MNAPLFRPLLVTPGRRDRVLTASSESLDGALGAFRRHGYLEATVEQRACRATYQGRDCQSWWVWDGARRVGRIVTV